MLKNKKVIYFLLLLVVLIWGVVFYKIFSNFSEKKVVLKSLSPPSFAIGEGNIDSIFTLSLNYPDPFLKGQGHQKDNQILLTTNNIVNRPAVIWPNIEYRGSLTNNGKDGSTAFLKINNSDLLVKQGKVYSQTKIQSITKDSILLEYQKVSRWLHIVKK